MWPDEGEPERRKTKREERQVVVSPHILTMWPGEREPGREERKSKKKER
jgi:hypothetical protein